MIGLIQRVTEAAVSVDGQLVGQINQGILLLLGVEQGDDHDSMRRLCQRVLNYRIFTDQHGKMNLNVSQINGSVLVVPQFTLVADTGKGNRPGFSRAAPPSLAAELFEGFVDQVNQAGIPCQSGRFGADMQVSLVNDGPVTFWLQV